MFQPLRPLLALLLALAPLNAAATTETLMPDHAGAPIVDLDADQAFNINKSPLSEVDLKLLRDHGYRFDSAGLLIAPDVNEPVGHQETFYILEDLRSRYRLQALLKIRLIQSRNNFDKELPATELNAIRQIGRENWQLFSPRSRQNLKQYFTSKEVAQLNAELPPPRANFISDPTPLSLGEVPHQIPVPTDAPLKTFMGPLMPLALKEASPSPRPANTRPADLKRKARHIKKWRKRVKPERIETYASAAFPIVRGVPAHAPKPIKALPAPWANERPQSKAKPPEEIRALPAPWATPAAPVKKKKKKTPKAKKKRSVKVASIFTPGLPTTTAMAANLGASPLPTKAMAAAPPPMAAAPAPAAAKKIPQRALPAPETPAAPPKQNSRPSAPVAAKAPAPRPAAREYPPFDPDNFRRFLETAPYGRGVKPLLERLARFAAEPDRTAALGVLMQYLPHIVVDSRKASEHARGRLSRLTGEVSKGRYQIALNDGPVLIKGKRLFLKNNLFMVPSDRTFFESRGLPAPQIQAMSPDHVAELEEESDWGRVRIYADGSMRLHRSEEALAGTLLHQLLMMDGGRRGWRDEFHAELRAEAAEFRFYQAIEAATGKAPRLDRELRARLLEWKGHPEDYYDYKLHAYMSRQVLDVGRVLQAAGLVTQEQREMRLGAPENTGKFRLPLSNTPASRSWRRTDRAARAEAEKKKKADKK